MTKFRPYNRADFEGWTAQEVAQKSAEGIIQ